MLISSHQRLDHVHPLCPESTDAMKDVDFVFCLGLVDEEVDGDERSRPSNPSAGKSGRPVHVCTMGETTGNGC